MHSSCSATRDHDCRGLQQPAQAPVQRTKHCKQLAQGAARCLPGASYETNHECAKRAAHLGKADGVEVAGGRGDPVELVARICIQIAHLFAKGLRCNRHRMMAGVAETSMAPTRLSKPHREPNAANADACITGRQMVFIAIPSTIPRQRRRRAGACNRRCHAWVACHEQTGAAHVLLAAHTPPRPAQRDTHVDLTATSVTKFERRRAHTSVMQALRVTRYPHRYLRGEKVRSQLKNLSGARPGMTRHQCAIASTS